MLAKLLTQMIELLQSIGYKVVVVNADQSAVNRKAFSLLGVTKDDYDQQTFGTFDVPHLFKSVGSPCKGCLK